MDVAGQVCPNCVKGIISQVESPQHKVTIGDEEYIISHKIITKCDNCGFIVADAEVKDWKIEKTNYPRPNLTVDIVVFYDKDVLLIRRKNEPFANFWALPGGFVEENEKLQDAALRELREETGLEGINAGNAYNPEDEDVLGRICQLGAFGDPGRDPRGWTVSVAFCTILIKRSPVVGKDDAVEARWFPVYSLPDLAFDHQKIIEKAHRKFGVEWKLIPRKK